MSSHPVNNTESTTARRDFIGRCVVIVAVLMWSTGGVFAKAPIFETWDGAQRGVLLAFWRTLFGGLVLLPFVRQPRWSWRFVPLCVSFAMMNLTYLSSMSLGEASIAIWLQSTAPVWVFAGSALWLREKIRPRDWLMFAFGVTGILTILVFEVHSQRSRGVLLGLASGFFYATIVLSLRRLRQFDPFWLIALSHLATVGVLAPLVWRLETLPTASQCAVLASFGIFQMGIPYVLFSWGLRSIPGHEASCIGLLEPILLPIFVFFAWGQTSGYQAPATSTIVGGTLILAGLMIRYFRRDVTK